MEFDLDTLNKNDFLPLLSQNIKQELFETTATEETACDSPPVNQPEDDPAPPADSETPAEGDGAPMSNKCVWCAQSLTLADNPKLLECLHVSCENCLKAKFSNATTVLCVACSMPNQMVGIIDNQFLVEQITLSEELAAAAASTANGADKDAAPTIKCSSCSDDAVATSWCVECAEYICDSCVQAHQRLKITKDHTIKSKEESTSGASSNPASGEKNIMCPVHAQEKLSLFCETCDRLTCRDCQLVHHRDHKYKFANEIAADTRSTLNSLLGEISYKRVLLTSAMKVIDDRQAMITDKKKESVREIKNMVMRVTNGINMRSKILVMRLNEVCDSKLRVLHEKKLALQHLSGHTDHCIDFVQNALDKGSDSAVLFSKKALVKHLQQVKCQRADIPNPEIPVRIQVLLNGVNDILKDLSAMGTIVVDGKVYPPQLPSLTPHPGPVSGANSSGGRSSTGGSSGAQNNQPGGGPGRQQQQPSPNMAPLIRLGGMIPPGLPGQGVQQGGQGEPFPMYPGNPSPNASFPSQSGMPGLSRQFSQDPTPPPPSLIGPQQRFPPNLINRSGQTHGPGPLVSSSTHPQNIDMNLRSLLNSQTGNGPNNMQNQQQMRGMQGGPFGGVNSNGGNGPPPPPPPQNMRGHYGRIQGASPGTAFGSTSPANFMGQQGNVGGSGGNMTNQGPRFQGQCPPNCGPNINMRGQMQQNQFPNQQNNNSGPSGNQSPFMNNNMGGFPPQIPPLQPQQQNQPQQQQQQHSQNRMSMNSGAKWHIPQSLQQQQQMQMQQQQQQQNGLPGFMTGQNQMGSGMMQNNNNNNMNNNSNNAMGGSGGSGGLAGFLNGNMGNRTPDASFKINLKSPPSAPMGLSMLPSMKQGPPNVIVINSGPMPNQANVSSTIPKTPSPSVNDSSKDSDSIDKLCAESMNDLMVTIAKLDSNGVQVLPEGRTKTTSPLVHSSTDITIEDKNGQKDDPNEDWCAVCLDGGELMCCDKCPKVFHQNCHIPPISNLPDESETWQCLLCMAVNDIRGADDQVVGEKRSAPGEMSSREFKILQRILLEIYCQYDISLPFREPEPAINDNFYNLISHPICLEDIKRNLDVNNPHHYRDVQSFVNDVRLIFKNSNLYHEEMKLVSKIIEDGRALEHFFEQLMIKWMPGHSNTESANDDRHKYPLKRPRQSIELD